MLGLETPLLNESTMVGSVEQNVLQADNFIMQNQVKLHISDLELVHSMLVHSQVEPMKSLKLSHVEILTFAVCKRSDGEVALQE